MLAWVDFALLPLLGASEAVRTGRARGARACEALAGALEALCTQAGGELRTQAQFAQLLRALVTLASAPRDSRQGAVSDAGGDTPSVGGAVSEEAAHCAVRALIALMERAEREGAACAYTLRGVANSPGVGHLLSALLGVCAAEAEAGAAGSRALLTDAARALSRALRAVGNADDLAFFLPGVASGICKLLVKVRRAGACTRTACGAHLSWRTRAHPSACNYVHARQPHSC